jgi:hypothetical protein
MTSARPSRTILNASPMADEPEVQAFTTPKLGPLKPYLIDNMPGAKFMTALGIVNG